MKQKMVVISVRKLKCVRKSSFLLMHAVERLYILKRVITSFCLRHRLPLNCFWCFEMMFSLLSFQDGESGSLDFEDFPSSPKSPLSPKRPWQARENNRNCMYYNCAIYSFVNLFSVLTPLLSFSYWLCLFLCSQPRGQGWIVLHWSNLENSNRTFEGVSMSGLGHTLF